VARRIAVISAMIRRMSGLESRPVMRDAEMAKQTVQMRKQMDELIRVSKMSPEAR
jgi:hypothetical protein